MPLSHQCSLSGFALQIIVLQIILTVPSTSSDDCPCQEGVPRGGFCYRLLKDSTSIGDRDIWLRSRGKCRELEFDMPMVKTKNDTERLRNIINTLKPKGMGTWLGLGDPGCTDRWRWIDATPAKYFNWSISEPKYKENCVYMSYERGWEEVQCGGQKRETICERPCSGSLYLKDLQLPRLDECPAQEKIKYNIKIHTKKGHSSCHDCTESTMLFRFVDSEGDKTSEAPFYGAQLEDKRLVKDLYLKDIGLIKSMIIRRNDTKNGYWKFNYFALKIEKYDETYFFESANGVFSYDTEIPVFNRTGKPRPESTTTTPRATRPRHSRTPRPPPVVTKSKAPNTTLAPPKQVGVLTKEADDSDSDLSTVEWIAIAVGIIVALVIIVVIFVLKRKKASADKSKTGPSAPAPTPTGNKPPAPASTGTAPVLDEADKDLKSERSEKSDDEGSESESEAEDD